MSLAPIAFFAYKRPEHTLRSLESLAKNHGAESSELFIFCDGNKNSEDDEAVKQVRQIAENRQWCGKIHIIKRKQNIGLAKSIICGVAELCSKYGKVIVLEDDLVLSPFFLEYMNKSLDLYEQESQVVQISGYMFPVKLSSLSDAVFMPFPTSWGWATWERAWKHFDAEMSGYALLNKNRRLKYKFNLNNSYPYFDMLEQQIEGNIDSWAIRWYLSTFMIDGITLWPIHSLVKNIGFDGSGTHCGESSSSNMQIYPDKILSMPTNIQSDNTAANIVFSYLRSLSQPSRFLQRINQRLINLSRKVKRLKSEKI